MMEKRRYYRLKDGVKVEYKVTEAFRAQDLQALDMGGGGIRVEILERLIQGTPVEVKLHLPGGKEVCSATGKVAWQLPKKTRFGKDFYETGIEFIRMNLKDRLMVIHYVHTGLKRDILKH